MGELWKWESCKLPCKVREESGNPAIDDLRERVCELAGLDLEKFLEETAGGGPTKGRKNAGGNVTSTRKKAKAQRDKGETTGGDITPRQKLSKETRRTLANARNVLAMADGAHVATNRNLNKMYAPVPRALPEKLMMDVQRERVTMLLSNNKAASNGGNEEFDDEPKEIGANAPGTGSPGAAANTLDARKTANGRGHLRLHTAPSKTGGGGEGGLLNNSRPATSMAPSSLNGMGGMNMNGAMMEGAKGSDRRKSTLQPHLIPSELLGVNYKGDLFGSHGAYMDGMLYLSRMPQGNDRSTVKQWKKLGVENQSQPTSAPKSGSEAGNAGRPESTGTPRGANGSIDRQMNDGDSLSRGGGGSSIDGDGSINQVNTDNELAAKQLCVETLLQWSYRKENASRLVEEGAVEAVLRMSKTTSLRLQGYCSAVLKRFAATPLLRERLITRGAVSTIAELAAQCRKPEVQRNCMVALVSLTCANGDKAEERIVEDGIVTAMGKLVGESEDYDVLCAQGLYNLTCISEPYAHLDRVMKTIVAFAAASALPSVRHLCAAALCNLSDLPGVHGRLIEDGAIGTIGTIARSTLPAVSSNSAAAGGGGGGGGSTTRRVCALVLLSLSKSPHERSNMAAKGAVLVLFGLSNDEDLATRKYVARALLHLASDAASHGRMILEGAASALCNIAMASASSPPASRPASLCLSILSKHASTRITIAEEGGVPAVVTLLHSSTDVPTLCCTLVTLCHLSGESANHLPLLDQGALAGLLEVAKHPDPQIQQACALAIFAFSCGEEEAVQARVVAGGAVPHIIALCKGAKLAEPAAAGVTQRRCAATLCNLARCHGNIHAMVAQGTLTAIIDLLKTDEPLAVKYCCATLCLIAQDTSNCLRIIEEGAIPHLVAGAREGDTFTKQSCCAVLAALSSQEDCREKLCECGALTALTELAASSDATHATTRLRCVIAIANLSCEVTIQGAMVSAGVAKVLSSLSNSYKEEKQRYCASALCNLACHHGSELLLVQQGAVAALMMISMVRSVSLETKQICSKALLNLLTPETLPVLLDEGIVAGCTNLSKLTDEQSMRACATLFAVLTGSPLGREGLYRRRSALVAVFDLLRSEDHGTKALVGVAITNLVCSHDSQAAAVAAGAVPALIQLASLGIPRLEASVASTFYLMSCRHKECRVEVTGAALPTVVYLSRSLNAAARWACAKALCTLAWHDDSRPALTGMDVSRAIITIIEDQTKADKGADPVLGNVAVEAEAESLEVCARALYHLASDSQYIPAMIEAGAVKGLALVVSTRSTPLILGVAAAALRCLTEGAPPPSTSIPVDRDSLDSPRFDEEAAQAAMIQAAEACAARNLVIADQGGGKLAVEIAMAVQSDTDKSTGSVNGASDADASITYDCACALYFLARSSPGLVAPLVSEGAVTVLKSLAKRGAGEPNAQKLRALASATLCLLCSDAGGSRDAVVAAGGAEAVLALLTGLSKDSSTKDTSPLKAGDTSGPKQRVSGGFVNLESDPCILTNATSAVYMMSLGKVASRDVIRQLEPLMKALSEISKPNSPVTEQNRKVASDALNNLSNTSCMAGLEEGAVSALISRSLKPSSTSLVLLGQPASPTQLQSSESLGLQRQATLSSVESRNNRLASLPCAGGMDGIVPGATPHAAPPVERTRPGRFAPNDEGGDAFEVEKVVYIKMASKGGGALPPPPEPPAIGDISEGDGSTSASTGNPEGWLATALVEDESDSTASGAGNGDEAAGGSETALNAMKFAKIDAPESQARDEDLIEKMMSMALLKTKGKLLNQNTSGAGFAEDVNSNNNTAPPLYSSMSTTLEVRTRAFVSLDKVPLTSSRVGHASFIRTNSHRGSSAGSSSSDVGNKETTSAPTSASSTRGGGHRSSRIMKSSVIQSGTVSDAALSATAASREANPASFDKKKATLGLYT